MCTSTMFAKNGMKNVCKFFIKYMNKPLQKINKSLIMINVVDVCRGKTK